MHHYPFHPGDYMLDTAHLEPMEDLAYRRFAWQDCLQHAFEEAAVGIENWEYAGYESEEEKVMTFKAAKEVAKLIRAMGPHRNTAQ